MTEYARNRLSQGDSHVHIVRDLLLGLEDEADATVDIGVPTSQGVAIAGEVRFTEDSVEKLDEALGFRTDERPHQTSFTNAIYAELAVSMLSAASGAHTNAADF